MLGLGTIFTGLRIAAILIPLMYIFSVVSDYKSQAVTIEKLRQSNAKLTQQNEYWEGRYQRIVGANRDKKSAIAVYEEVIDSCCRRAFDNAYKANKQNALVKELFGDGT